MLEDLIESVGSWGPFQWMIMILIKSGELVFGYSMLIMSFGGMVPDWWCVHDDHPVDNLNTTVPSYKFCDINSTHSCSRKYESYTRTVIREFDLVCENSWIGPTVTSIQMGGVLAGAFIGGQCGDSFGRKKTIYAAFLFHSVFNFIIAFSQNWQMFAAFRFFIGFCIGAFLVICVYPLEFIGTKRRNWAASINFWAFGVLVLAFFQWLIHDWKYLHITCGVINIPYIFGWFIVPESVRWLATKGRLDEAKVVIERIAKFNGTKVPDNADAILHKIAGMEKENNEKGKQYTYIDIFRGVHYLKSSMCIQIIWLSLSAIYYGFAFGVSQFSGNFYLNFFLMNALELPLFLPLVFFLSKSRRLTTAIPLFMAAATCIAVLIIQETKNVTKSPTITGLSLTARLLVSASWVAMILLTNETYPTVVRYIGFGASNTSARIGGIIAPFIFSLGQSRMTPYIAMISLMTISGVATLFLSETLNKPLQDLMFKKDLGGTKPVIYQVTEDFKPLKNDSKQDIPEVVVPDTTVVTPM